VLGGFGLVQLYNDLGFLQVGEVAAIQTDGDSAIIFGEAPEVAGVTQMVVTAEADCATVQ
jgi:hypothetical protein